ncbi:hypothetical protein PSYPI_32428 [Pseudomonas syringae pv. pisi str. 1704B]|uniref:Uncharacterized protein n=1 Tax=Pseudomonas syringae pv. pisi str. 1704B TaxID=629263 RepID=F3GI51_PSESJ|nr:hypothetical protein PSYPI_32428 [Pseudomonas syringae pv. pisi str. 1704B]
MGRRVTSRLQRQTLQDLANTGAADLEYVGQGVLGQARSRSEPVFDDGFQYMLINLFITALFIGRRREKQRGTVRSDHGFTSHWHYRSYTRIVPDAEHDE